MKEFSVSLRQVDNGMLHLRKADFDGHLIFVQTG